MQKFKALALVALLAVSPLLFAAGSGGFPSRPKFLDMKVTGTTTAGQGGGICQIGLMPVGANQVLNLNESCDYARTNGNLTALSIGQANFQGLHNANINVRIGTSAVPGGTSVEANLQFHRTNRATYPEPSAIFLWDLGYTSSNLPGANVGHNFCLRRYDDTGTASDVGGTYGPCTFFIDRASGYVGIKNALKSEKACTAGYTRAEPNLCDSGTATLLLANTTCTLVETITSAYAPLARFYGLDVQIASNNLAAARGVTIGFYSDATCATPIAGASYPFSVYEQTATAAGTVLFVTHSQVNFRTAATSVYAKLTTLTGGANTGITINKTGYRD